jgi:hypothetical protein
MSRRFAALIGSLVLSLVAASAPATAASNTVVMALHGTKWAGKAMASATITMVGKGDFRVQITAEHLPAPTSLHAKPQRGVYLVWVIDGKHKNSMMGVLALKQTSVPGNYAANGTVMLQDVTEISVTADVSAKQHMPTMPMVAVLMSGKGMM